MKSSSRTRTLTSFRVSQNGGYLIKKSSLFDFRKGNPGPVKNRAKSERVPTTLPSFKPERGEEMQIICTNFLMRTFLSSKIVLLMLDLACILLVLSISLWVSDHKQCSR